jgi:histidyl-tRNA synthetase
MADKPKKPQKLRARLPRGLADRGPAEIAATRAMVEKIRSVYERYGFEPVETPAMEYTDALGKFLPDQDRPNEGVFSFQDDDEQWISLRYDLTAPLARYVAENFDSLPKPYRSYRAGYVYRNEKPGPGRFRQFMQFDADTVGSASPAADAEMCMMAADTMEALGIEPGSYMVKVNNRKILDGVMESVDLDGEENAHKRLTVLRALDKYDRLGLEGVEELLGPGRTDPSGDFTKGAGLKDWQIKPLLRFLRFGEIFSEIEQGVFDETELEIDTHFPNPFCSPPSTWDLNAQVDYGRMARKAAEWKNINPTGRVYDWSFNLDVLRRVAIIFDMNDTLAEGLNELAEMERVFQAGGYVEVVPTNDISTGGEEAVDIQISIDPSVVRGLEYYTGPIFEVELLLDTKDEKGRPVRFGSVGGGGRYDGLVSRFRGEPVPATGFSIGVSRLQAALTMLGKLDTRPEFGPVVVTVFDRDRIADYQKMVAVLRNADIRAELYLGNPKNMGNQLKYADRRNSPCVIIQGSDEKDDPAGPQVLLKDLVLGAELAKLEKDREEYLQKQSEAQTKVPEAALVDEVRKILDKHGVKWN